MSNLKRVVILGSKGFIGKATAQYLQQHNISVLLISREKMDFCSPSTSIILTNLLKPDDVVIIAAAKAPCKNNEMLLDNILMMKNICEVFKKKQVAQVIYISSDAVYADSLEPLTENTVTTPTALHGVMHLSRECMLSSVLEKEKLLFLRPTLIYGAEDPHQGYGPNLFYRLASQGQPILLFGQGEEQRDHVYIDDVAKIIYHCIQANIHGILNIASGHTITFAQIAHKIKLIFDNNVEIKEIPRLGPMPHQGYRAFNNNSIHALFPNFKFTLFDEGLLKMHHLLQTTIA